MADPISSLNQSSFPNACIDGEVEPASPAASPATRASSSALASQSLSQPEEPAVCAVPSSVKSLVDKFPAPTAAPPAGPSGPPVISVTHLTTSSGPVAGGSYRVSANVLDVQANLGPLHSNVEVGSVSVQFGKDKDAQAALLRRTDTLTHAGYSLSLTSDALAARANLGEHNDDGSLGGNIGSGAELLGTEGTLNTPYGSVTAGVSISASLSGSMGVRDADHDGKPEFCAKFSIPAYTLGACVEQFW